VTGCRIVNLKFPIFKIEVEVTISIAVTTIIINPPILIFLFSN